MRNSLGDLEHLIMGSGQIHVRTRGMGIRPAEVATAFGCSGPIIQASGIPMDSRKDEPYEKYAEVDFDVPVGTTGDCYDRLWVLVQRMWESCKIVEQCMDRLPPGQYISPKLPKKIKVPEGEIYVRTENPLGLMGYTVEGDGGDFPYRMKMRTASFSNVAMIPALLPGTLVPDLIAILGSIFFVVGDVDR